MQKPYKHTILQNLDLTSPFDRLNQLESLTEDEIKSTGYVVDSLEAVLWCFLKTDNYKDCIMTAINLGGDTDTIAAIAGSLAGMYYGIESVPKTWISLLSRSDLIIDITKEFSSLF